MSLLFELKRLKFLSTKKITIDIKGREYQYSYIDSRKTLERVDQTNNFEDPKFEERPTIGLVDAWNSIVFDMKS